LKGTKCVGKNNVAFGISIDIALAMWASISTDLTLFVVGAMQKVNPNF
jgi:hypothetical protein